MRQIKWFFTGIIFITAITITYIWQNNFTEEEMLSGEEGNSTLPNSTAVHTVPVKEADTIFETINASEPSVNHADFASSTSGKNSKYYLPFPSNNYSTGDVLSVIVETYDHSGKRRSSGGDFFIARLFNNKLNSDCSGTVYDFNNGTYLITFPLYWKGEAYISIKLYHSAQAVSVLRMLRENYTRRSAFKGIFVFSKVEENTECSFDMSPEENVCDFSDVNSGVKWFCRKPPKLSCGHFRYHQCYSQQQYPLNQQESQLLQSGNILTDIVPMGPSSIVVQSKDQAIKMPPCAVKPFEPKDSTGFVFNGTWNPSECQMQQFHTEEKVVQCLKGKKIYSIGDSTSRQWWEYLVNQVPSFNVVHKGKLERTDQHLAVEFTHNILLQWRPHGTPWETGERYNFLNLQPTANQINSIFGGNEFVIILSLGAHFTPFPLKPYIERLVNIKTALKRLLARNPGTKVIVKSTNTREVSSDLLFRSDWLTFQQNRAMKEVFKGLTIGFIDAWDVTVAYGSWAAHPSHHIIQNEVDLLLSYICPAE
ncbi:NXPE family member 4-like [Protopterus annectens]|uniref:NXPE family member 4-like n=1 Tax=Protopterus annectens TaxID=7888 RepID=UPI001CFA626D|nr:NXPE family member 4-like [Protopterus annectens]XP_043936350.1 NXPE family member 4-like [Protopterus annectens]